MLIFKHGRPSISAGFNPPFFIESFNQYISRLGFSPVDVSSMCDKSQRTVRGWLASDAPGWVYLYLYCCAGFFLDRQFKGFRVIDGQLWTGTRITRNRGFTPAELTEYTFFHDYLHQLERDNLSLRNKLETLTIRSVL